MGKHSVEKKKVVFFLCGTAMGRHLCFGVWGWGCDILPINEFIVGNHINDPDRTTEQDRLSEGKGAEGGWERRSGLGRQEHLIEQINGKVGLFTLSSTKYPPSIEASLSI